MAVLLPPSGWCPSLLKWCCYQLRVHVGNCECVNIKPGYYILRSRIGQLHWLHAWNSAEVQWLLLALYSFGYVKCPKNVFHNHQVELVCEILPIFRNMWICDHLNVSLSISLYHANLSCFLTSDISKKSLYPSSGLDISLKCVTRNARPSIYNNF